MGFRTILADLRRVQARLDAPSDQHETMASLAVEPASTRRISLAGRTHERTQRPVTRPSCLYRQPGLPRRVRYRPRNRAGFMGGDEVTVVAMYRVRDGMISDVWSIR